MRNTISPTVLCIEQRLGGISNLCGSYSNMEQTCIFGDSTIVHHSRSLQRGVITRPRNYCWSMETKENNLVLLPGLLGYYSLHHSAPSRSFYTYIFSLWGCRCNKHSEDGNMQPEWTEFLDDEQEYMRTTGRRDVRMFNICASQL